jgi:hypothetical protein
MARTRESSATPSIPCICRSETTASNGGPWRASSACTALTANTIVQRSRSPCRLRARAASNSGWSSTKRIRFMCPALSKHQTCQLVEAFDCDLLPCASHGCGGKDRSVSRAARSRSDGGPAAFAFCHGAGQDVTQRYVHAVTRVVASAGDYVKKSWMTALRLPTSNGLAMDTFATDARKLCDCAVKAPPVMNTTLRAAAGFDLASVS